MSGRPDFKLFTAALFLATLTMSPTATHAQGSKVSSPIERALDTGTLKPGEWVMAPQIAPSGPLMIYVDLSRQIASIYRNGVLIGASTISSGKPGYATPTGVFTILQKDIDHHSNEYDNASMPFSQRVTWSGVALHAGGLPGYPESHGCVHLPYELAKALFSISDLGATVIINEGNAVPMLVEGGGLLLPKDSASAAPAPDEDSLTAAGYDWHPETSPRGPVTLVLSRSDQLMIVMRNGLEIGRAKIEMPVTNMESHVLTLVQGSDGVRHWIYVGAPGHADDAGKQLDRTIINEVKIPELFRNAVTQIIQPGATILVTQAAINTGAIGEDLVVLNSTK